MGAGPIMGAMRSSLRLSEEFPRRKDSIYLNHAGVAPWPKRTGQAVKRFADENVALGPTRYDQWLVVEQRLRRRLRELINAPGDDDIALLKNTSEGLSTVAYGLPWQADDNIVTSDQEFPSNRIVWESLGDSGVELRQARLSDGATPEDALFDRVDAHTRLLTISSVQYATGLRMDLERIGAFCRERGILFCVDAIQSAGALRLDVQAAHIDFAVADGHKWMLGPEGVALFYVREAVRDSLRLNQYGWHMVEAYGDYDRSDWEPARSARRFECGSPNLLGIHGLEASLSLLHEAGMDTVEREVLKRSDYLTENIMNNNQLTLLSPTDGPRRSGIVTFRRSDAESGRLYESLRAQGIYCARRGGGIRFSPHFYTPLDDLQRALEMAARCGKA